MARSLPVALVTVAHLTLFSATGCRTSAAPEPEGEPSQAPTAATTTTTQAAAPPGAAPSGGDPLHGKFSLADATQGLPGTGPLMATIDTSMGSMTCKLYDDKAPNTVANFVGLATGKRSWLDPSSNTWTNKPAYDGTVFHRIIKGFMIQGGDPKGNGSGEPGYTIPDEMWPGVKHDRAGLLCMANRGKNTNGAQFFITESDGPSVKALDGYGTYTVFGECGPIPTIHAIAAVTTSPGDRPVIPVTIKSIKITR